MIHRKVRRMATYATGAIFLALATLPNHASGHNPDADGFTSLISQGSLSGWSGDPAFFSVKDGILRAGSPAPVEKNTFLVLDEPHDDFELRYRYRWATPTGNSGIQFRSGMAEGHFAMAGMQANVTPVTPRLERFGMLYEELGDRAEMVLLGQKAEVTRRAAGRGGQGRVVRTVTSMVNSREDIVNSLKPYPEWNEVVLIAHGPRIVHVINGLVAFDATDSDPLARRDGLIGIQVHAGDAMIVEFADLRIRKLDALPDLRGYRSNPMPAPEPRVTYKDSTRVAMADVALPEE